MRKIKFPLFFCFLVLEVGFFSGCASTATPQTTLHPFQSSQNQPLIKKKGALPPALIQVIQRPDRVRVVLYSDYCFQANGYLTSECSRQLVNTIKTLQQYGDGLIQVVGYTDDIYDPTTAKELSQHQADAVVAFLWLQGISSERLLAIGGGKQNPNASNRSVRGSAANRRVELIRVK